MKKKISILCLVLVCVLVLAGCGCKHETWNDADCVTPKTCAECGETEGEALGHDWVDADCVNPKTCAECGETEGDALGHDWVDADCVNAKTCSVCGETEGEALGHAWEEATCETAKTCSVCGETEGEALGHSFGEWVEIDENNEEHTCEACGYSEQQNIDRQAKLMRLLEGDWELIGFCIEDAVYSLDQIQNSNQWKNTLHFESDGNVKQTYLDGSEFAYVLNISSYLMYEANDAFGQYSFVMEDDQYIYVVCLFTFTDGSTQLWAQLDQDFWIFEQN